MKKLILLILILIIFIVGCSKKIENNEADVVKKCIEKCSTMGVALTESPCLGPVAEDWVCDVAHSPRQAIDNLPENQCQDFREGKATHFVEITPNCDLIRKV